MKTSSVITILIGAFGFSAIGPYAFAAESNAVPADPTAVQLLGKLPSGEMVLFDGQKLFQFMGSYKKIAVVDATSGVISKNRKPLYGEPILHVDVYRAWPVLQRKAAALGANAVIITGEAIAAEGFATRHGVPGDVSTIGEVIGDAVFVQGTTKQLVDLTQGLSADSHLLNSVRTQSPVAQGARQTVP